MAKIKFQNDVIVETNEVRASDHFVNDWIGLDDLQYVVTAIDGDTVSVMPHPMQREIMDVMFRDGGMSLGLYRAMRVHAKWLAGELASGKSELDKLRGVRDAITKAAEVIFTKLPGLDISGEATAIPTRIAAHCVFLQSLLEMRESEHDKLRNLRNVIANTADSIEHNASDGPRNDPYDRGRRDAMHACVTLIRAELKRHQ